MRQMTDDTEQASISAAGLNRWDRATTESRSAIKWISTTLAAGVSSSGVLALYGLTQADFQSLPTKVVCEIALLAMLGTAGLTGSIYALMRTLVPKPRSLGQINSRTEKRNQGIISELLPPEVETLNDLGNSLVSYAVAASEMSVMAADATDQEESRALANLVQVQIRNYRVLAERRDRILARLEQVQLRHDILTSSLIFLAGLMIAAAAFIPASVKSRSKIESPRIFVLHPAVEEAQERWSRLGVEPCAVGREKELAVAWTGADPPSAGSLVTTLGFPEECRRVSLILPTWVTITALNMEKSQ